MPQRPALLSLWSLPQPIYVLGCALLTASAVTTQWIDSGLLVTLLLSIQVPLLLLLERLAPKRKDWLLNWQDLAEDAFWVLATLFIWIPLFEDYYETPISAAFVYLRDSSSFPFRLEAQTMTGLLAAALLGIIAIEFIAYWLHRLQHRFMFFWRMHATHHHITKMSAARADRTHPLEFLALTLGGAIALAFLGASPEVISVVLVIRVTTAYTCHTNLPLEPGIFGWLFNTPAWHQLHHSCNYAESNTNYGCTIILWDRVFGTFSAKESIERVGNGTGEQLSLWMQLTMPFRSNKTLRSL